MECKNSQISFLGLQPNGSLNFTMVSNFVGLLRKYDVLQIMFMSQADKFFCIPPLSYVPDHRLV